MSEAPEVVMRTRLRVVMLRMLPVIVGLASPAAAGGVMIGMVTGVRVNDQPILTGGEEGFVVEEVPPWPSPGGAPRPAR